MEEEGKLLLLRMIMRKRILQPLLKRWNQKKRWKKISSQYELQQNGLSMSLHEKGGSRYLKIWMSLKAHL